MSHKLASTIVCLGITIGILSAPKPSRSSGPLPQIIAPAIVGSVNSPSEKVTGSIELQVRSAQPDAFATNSFGISFQH